MTDNAEREAPRVLGVEMNHSHSSVYTVYFSRVFVELEGPLCDGGRSCQMFTWRVGSSGATYAKTEAEAIAAIERELLAIRAAIPAPEPKPCWSCGATLPGPSPEESRQRQEAWEVKQKGGTDG